MQGGAGRVSGGNVNSLGRREAQRFAPDGVPQMSSGGAGPGAEQGECG